MFDEMNKWIDGPANKPRLNLSIWHYVNIFVSGNNNLSLLLMFDQSEDSF